VRLLNRRRTRGLWICTHGLKYQNAGLTINKLSPMLKIAYTGQNLSVPNESSQPFINLFILHALFGYATDSLGVAKKE
jgi:hypothetical protein